MQFSFSHQHPGISRPRHRRRAGILGACLALLAALAPATPAREVAVRSTAEARQALAALAPGDAVVFASGSYELGKVVIAAQGTPQAPILIRAAEPGKSVFTGHTGLTFEKAAGVTLTGFVFATTDTSPVVIAGSHQIRISRNTLRVTETGKPTGRPTLCWIQIRGAHDGSVNSHHNRIDHNLIEGKRVIGQVVAINGLDAPVFQCSQYDRIDHNHFRNIGPRISNGMETIRTGLSQLSLSSGFTTIEDNLFEACDGDPEVISVKNCGSVVRRNTFVRCQGGVCLRHGNRSEVSGNFFFGENKRDTHGVRVYGDDHKVFNNYFQDLAGPTIEIDGGDADYPAHPDPARDGAILKSHVRPRRVTVAFNTFVHDALPFALGGRAAKGSGLAAQDVTIADNVVLGNGGRVAALKGAVELLAWLGNLADPGVGGEVGVNVPAEQIRVGDLKMKEAGALWRPQPGSPVIGAARGKFDFVAIDMDGQARPEPKDVGADQVEATAPVKFKPLTAAEVGPEAPGEE